MPPSPGLQTASESLLSPRSLAMVASHQAGRRIAAVLLGLVALVALTLIFVPWQQTIIGYGQVIVYSAMDRPQTVEAQIPGRLIEWRVQEGDTVQKGDVIARLDDIDSKFLDRDQPRRLAAQQKALRKQRSHAALRAARLETQISSLNRSRTAAIQTARQRVEQSRQRVLAAEQALIATQKGKQIARDVVRTSAVERVTQARLRIEQADQALTAAAQDRDTARLQRDRIQALFDEDLRSQRDNELAQNDFVKRQTEVGRAELALKVTRRDATVGNLDQNRADIEIARVGTEVERAKAALDVSQRDVLTAQLDLSKATADTSAALDSIRAAQESAWENVAKLDSDLQKLDIEQQNLQRRTEQQNVVAPRSGRVVRLLQVGAGTTVKAGDALAVLSPATSDRAVELLVTDNDVALLSEGRQVRLQLAGWPALQFSGWPSATGTFAGTVSVIDAIDDGTARYRIIVKPDKTRIASGKEQPWPPAHSLRPGAEATGWILLETVPLGFELWRQFNAFPATIKKVPVGQKIDKDESGASAGAAKSDGDKKKSPFLKVKSPK